MSRANVGLNAIYNGGLTAGYSPAQSGTGFLDKLKKANDWAKKHKIGTKIGAVVDAVGGTDYLNKKTGGYYGKAITEGKKRGYGKKKSSGGRKKRTTRRR